MKNLYYLKQGHLEDSKHHLPHNFHYYTEDEPWLDNFFKEGAWYLASKVKYNEFDLKLYDGQESKAQNDLENTMIVYNALKGLTIVQASDERLWASMTHSVCWKYMRSRWPIETYLDNPNGASDNIKERYFLVSNRSRALVRNGISRLWWYGHASYDESRSNPFELTEILLRTTDIAASLTERAFSHNKAISIAILSILKEFEDEGYPFLKRDMFRDLMKYINQTGGLTVLDSLNHDDLKKNLSKKIGALQAKEAA